MRTGMMIYFDALEEYQELTDEQFGRLIRAGLRYAKDGEQAELQIPEKYLYPGLRLKIDRDASKYDEKCRKLTENANKRWNPQQPGDNAIASNSMQTHPNGCNSCQEKEKSQYQEKEKLQSQSQPQENAARAALIREGYTKEEIDRAMAAAEGQTGIRDLTAYVRRAIQNERQRPAKTVIAQQYEQRDYSTADAEARAEFERMMDESTRAEFIEQGYSAEAVDRAMAAYPEDGRETMNQYLERTLKK